jgi:hypothetical protein
MVGAEGRCHRSSRILSLEIFSPLKVLQNAPACPARGTRLAPILATGISQKGAFMKLRTMLAIAATAACVPLAASWAGEPTGPQGTFLWNNTYRGPAFSTLDLNGDGIVTSAEYAAATGQPAPAAPVVVAPAAPVVVAPAAPIVATPVAPVQYAPVVAVAPTPTPHYSWFSADSNPPAPAQ